MQRRGRGEDRATAGHPGTEWQFTETLGDGGNEPEVFEDVLGREVTREDATTVTALKARAEDLLGEQNSETVVKQHAVSVVGQMSLGGIHPLM